MLGHCRKSTAVITNATLWRSVAIVLVLPVVSDREAFD